jgi:putative DNA primase/helicase
MAKNSSPFRPSGPDGIHQGRNPDGGNRRGLHSRKKAPLLVKIANAEDEATGDGYDVFRYRKPLGRKGLIQIARDKALEWREVTSLLARKNADLSIGDSTAEASVKRALSKPPREHWLMARHVGWRPDRGEYVLQNRVIGKQTGKQITKPPLWLNDRQRTVLTQEGDLDSWKTFVAAVSGYSSRLMLLMSASWAALLLEIVKLQPFAINLFGRSKCGKTTALLAGASIIGIGSESQLPNWNTTDGGFQETARLFNDAIMPANELALLRGSKRDAYARIRQLTYVFSEGRDTSRNSGSAFAVAASSAIWRGILISTAENSFDALAAACGEHRDHGELARSHDVPAVTKGHSTIFDRFPIDVPKNKRRSWSRRQLRLLREACAGNHGWAIDPVIQKIIDLGDDAEKYVRKCIREFMVELGRLPGDGALRHAAQNFGCVFAGGCLGIETGMVPWSRSELAQAIVACFHDFLAVVRKHDSVPREAKHILLDKLRSLNLPIKIEGKYLDRKPKIGFYRQLTDSKRFVISSKAFASWFPDERHERAALLWLDRTAKLHKTSDSGAPSGTNKKWAVKFSKWSRNQSIRAIEFDDPRPK